MTACTNKARGAVVAALAGALALGAVPAVALATGGEISTLAVTEWGNAEIKTAQNGKNGSVTYEEGISFDYSTGEFLVPTSIQGVEDVYTLSAGDYELRYFGAPIDTSVDGNGYYDGLVEGGTYIVDGAKVTYKASEGMSLAMAKDYFSGTLKTGRGYTVRPVAGTYRVDAVRAGEQTAPGFYFDVEVVSSLEGAYAYIGDTSNTTFTFNNTALLDQIEFADKSGHKISPSVRWTTPDGASVDSTQVVPAGDYVAQVTLNGESAEIAVTINPLDITKAAVSHDDVLGAGNLTNKEFLEGLEINGESIAPSPTGNALSYYLKVDSRVDVNGSNADYRAMGPHTVTISVDESKLDDYIDLTDSIIGGPVEVSFARLNTNAFTDGAKVYYGDYDITATGSISVDMFAGQTFDANKIKVVYKGKTYSGSQLQLSFSQNGRPVDGAALAKGAYDLDIRLQPTEDSAHQWFGGTFSAEVNVTGASIDADQRLYFYFDGKLAGNGTETTYDGTDQLEKLKVVVKDADGNDIDPSNYEVKVTDASGKEVESATDAGDYKVTVTGKTFDFDEGTNVFDLKVSPVVVKSVAPVWDVELDDSSAIDGYLNYTGEVLTPSFRFLDADGEEVEVPAEAYEVVYNTTKDKDVELKEVGTYYADFSTAVDVKNYVVDVEGVRIDVTDKGLFLDVPMGEWYSQPVYDAVNLGYMNGDGGTKFFSPMRELTRAEAVCVLFNMAGGEDAYVDETIPGYNPVKNTYETGFSDVEGGEFFAKAVAWAKATGVVNGYADGTFGVSRKVTNEEFACMLANYAKAAGDYAEVDADEVLAAYPDASAVSDWAEASVAWAVSEGVMGNGSAISPAGSILRMRAAAMAVNYQPEKLGDIVIGIPDHNTTPLG